LNIFKTRDYRKDVDDNELSYVHDSQNYKEYIMSQEYDQPVESPPNQNNTTSIFIVNNSNEQSDHGGKSNLSTMIFKNAGVNLN